MTQRSTPNKPELVESFLKALESPAKTLTKWELSFIESISDQFERKHFLTDRQFETLEKIYAEKTA